jgi:hypothetical protein
MSLARLMITGVTAEARGSRLLAVYASVSPAAAAARLTRARAGKFSRLRRHTVATFCLDSLLEDV